jgi:hypothetical protein
MVAFGIRSITGMLFVFGVVLVLLFVQVELHRPMHDGSCARVFFEAYWASCKQETSLTFDAEQSQTAA